MLRAFPQEDTVVSHSKEHPADCMSIWGHRPTDYDLLRRTLYRSLYLLVGWVFTTTPCSFRRPPNILFQGDVSTSGVFRNSNTVATSLLRFKAYSLIDAVFPPLVD